MNRAEIIPGLFKKEFAKITAVLIRRFGIQHIELAENIASETFLTALEVWPYKGVLRNPEDGSIPWRAIEQ